MSTSQPSTLTSEQDKLSHRMLLHPTGLCVQAAALKISAATKFPNRPETCAMHAQEELVREAVDAAVDAAAAEHAAALAAESGATRTERERLVSPPGNRGGILVIMPKCGNSLASIWF